MRTARKFFRFGLGPLAGYAIGYFLLTYPRLFEFSSMYYCEDQDGPQMIWDVWWVKHALLDLHQLPWHTTLLHYPHGSTLLLHTVTPLNGLIGIPLSWFGSQVQVYNTLVVLSFALSGLTTVWLAYDLTKSYWPSIAAGYAFAFCAYRFAHAYGHLSNISTAAMPLFMLLWLRMLDRPSARLAIGAGICLIAALLADHYLFMFCILAAIVSAGWWIMRRGVAWRSRAGVRTALAFLLTCGLTSGPLAIATMRQASSEPIRRTHDPEFYPADLEGLLIPGWVWHYHRLTEPSWRASQNYNETSVSIGLAVFAMGVYGYVRAARVGQAQARVWMPIAIIFTALALGPTLNLGEMALTRWMPYRALQALLPPIRMAGCTARFMIVTQLAFAMLSAVGLAALSASGMTRRVRVSLIVLFVVAMVVESQPRLPATFDPKVPAWVELLRDHPEPGAVIDVSRRRYNSLAMYYQTIHRRPIGDGDLSRVPADVEDATRRMIDAGDAGDIDVLRSGGFRFLVVGATRPALSLPVIYEDRSARVYQIEAEPK